MQPQFAPRPIRRVTRATSGGGGGNGSGEVPASSLSLEATTTPKAVLLTIGVLSFALFLLPEGDIETVFGFKVPQIAQPRPLVALGIVASILVLISRLNLRAAEARIVGRKVFVLLDPLERKLLDSVETVDSTTEYLRLGKYAGATWRLINIFIICTSIILGICFFLAIGLKLFEILMPVINKASVASCAAEGWPLGTSIRNLPDPCAAWIYTLVFNALALIAFLTTLKFTIVAFAPRREGENMAPYHILLLPVYIVILPIFYIAYTIYDLIKNRLRLNRAASRLVRYMRRGVR